MHPTKPSMRHRQDPLFIHRHTQHRRSCDTCCARAFRRPGAVLKVQIPPPRLPDRTLAEKAQRQFTVSSDITNVVLYRHEEEGNPALHPQPLPVSGTGLLGKPS